MDIAKAKEYFHLGLVKEAHIQPDIMGRGYIVQFNSYTGNARPILETARKPRELRRFKTLDAAAKAINEIGIRYFTVLT